MKTCSNCKHWNRECEILKQDISTGEMFSAIIINGNPKYDPEKFTIVEHPTPYGSCSEIEENEYVSTGTSYGDGIRTYEKFGCVLFEQKET